MKFNYLVQTLNKKNAIDEVKDLFYQEYGIRLDDAEIVSVQEEK